METKKFRYADKNEQLIRTNRLLVLNFGVFYSMVLAVLAASLINGERTMGFCGAIAVIMIVSLLSIGLFFRINQKDARIKWVALVANLMVIFLLTFAFDSYFFRFAAFVPLVAYILFFDRKFMLSAGVSMNLVQIGTLVMRMLFKVDPEKGTALQQNADAMWAIFASFLMTVLACFVERVAHEFIEDMLGSIAEEKEHQAAMMEDVLYVAGEVRKGTNDAMEIMNKLNDSTNVVTSAMKDISDSTQCTAENIQTQTVMTQSIQDSIDETIARSEDMVQIAVRSTNLNDANLAIMNQILDQSRQVADINGDVSASMNTLVDKSEAVKSIADTIFEISSQTNLLALNASIESARAGEAGRGFAVVANEIRALAEKTRSETENIATLLTDLSNQAIDAANAVKLATEAASVQEGLISQASASFEDMNLNVSQLTSNIAEIDKMLNSLADANNQIVENITQLSATTEEVTAASTQAENLSDENLINADNTKEILANVLAVSAKLDKYTA